MAAPVSRFELVAWLLEADGKNITRGLKPRCLCAFHGTDKAVPFQKVGFMQPSLPSFSAAGKPATFKTVSG
jgi:hypothetical protein